MLLLALTQGNKTLIMIVAIILVFYFFLIRPQSQQAKKEEKYRKGLKKGDRVMTSGGIHATVVSTGDGYALIEVAPNTRFKVQLGTLNPLPGEKMEKEDAE